MAANSNNFTNGLAEALSAIALGLSVGYSRRSFLGSVILTAVGPDDGSASGAVPEDVVDPVADEALRGLCAALLAVHAAHHDASLDLLPPSGLRTSWVKERVAFLRSLREFVDSGVLVQPPASSSSSVTTPGSAVLPLGLAHPAPSAPRAAESSPEPAPPVAGGSVGTTGKYPDDDLMLARLQKAPGVYVPGGLSADLWIVERLSRTPGRLVSGSLDPYAEPEARAALGARPYGALLAVGRSLGRSSAVVRPEHYVMLLTALVDRLRYLNARRPHSLHSEFFRPLYYSVEAAAAGVRRLLADAADHAAAGVFGNDRAMEWARADATLVASLRLSVAAHAATDTVAALLPPKGTVDPATAYYAYLWAFVHSIGVAAPGAPGWFLRMPQHPLVFSPAICAAARDRYPCGVVYEVIDGSAPAAGRTRSPAVVTSSPAAGVGQRGVPRAGGDTPLAAFGRGFRREFGRSAADVAASLSDGSRKSLHLYALLTNYGKHVESLGARRGPLISRLVALLPKSSSLGPLVVPSRDEDLQSFCDKLVEDLVKAGMAPGKGAAAPHKRN